MKKIFCSTIAAVGATVLAFSSAVQVFAFDEDNLQNGLVTEEAISKNQFLSTFSDSNLQQVASCCLEEGLSVNETSALMETYQIGLEQIQAESEVLPSPYYNTSALCDTKHFIAAIVIDPSQALDEIFDLVINNSRLTYNDGDAFLCFPYTQSQYTASFNSRIPANLVTASTTTIRTDVTANALSASTSEGVLRYKVNPTSNTTSERTLYGSISLNDRLGNGNIAFETFALGDVDHNGVVNAVDVTYLTDFVTFNRSDFNFIYSDGSNHYSAATNGLAADTNQDNAVDIRDVAQLNQYLNGNSNTLVD
ncbi:MAG: dockerin type I domain-containing protein [Oscillospiraceae bacterium]|nr:dockerin type I domain-containing protein [Oscillospiraceae bacterium]